jgi:Tfp pilus assembly protein PilP
MKSLFSKIAIARRFPLLFVLLLAMTVLAFSISAAQEQAGSNDGTPADNPPAPVVAGEAQEASPASVDQSSEPKAAETVPAASEQTAKVEVPLLPQLPEATAQQQSPVSRPPEYAALIEKTASSLTSANFTFYPIKALDPFVPFIVPETSNSGQGEDDQQNNGVPLTPLQKMTMSEIERGLKAITWGDLGRKAVIEDSTGRGYIVGVGTPAGEHSGVVSQILNDRLVIKQEIWDGKARKRFPQDFTIKLVKKTDEKS